MFSQENPNTFTAQGFQYQQEWDTKLAERLDKPQNWKEVCDVVYTDTQTYNFPYIGTSGEPAATTGFFTTAAARSTLSNVVTFTPVTESNDTLVIVTTDYEAVFVDYADQAQSNFAKMMNFADLLGKKIGERVESIVMNNDGNWTNMGDDGSGNVALASTALTVSTTNIDDIVRGVIEQIQTANGFNLYQQNGGFVVWRPADWTKLVAFMQANGFATADSALQNGNRTEGTAAAPVGVPYMGLYHYVTTLGHAGHLMAGVRKVQKFGLLTATYGKTYTSETPPSNTAGMLSGTGMHTRLDYGHLVQTNVAPLIYDINVA